MKRGPRSALGPRLVACLLLGSDDPLAHPPVGAAKRRGDLLRALTGPTPTNGFLAQLLLRQRDLLARSSEEAHTKRNDVLRSKDLRGRNDVLRFAAERCPAGRHLAWSRDPLLLARVISRPASSVATEHPLPDRWEQLRTIARNQESPVRCDVRTGHLTGARRERKKEVVPSNLRLGLSASYCPFGLSASRIVGGPFGPFLSIARNHPVRYSAPVQAPRDFRPFLLGTRSPVVLCSRPVYSGLWWWSSGLGLPPPERRGSPVSASEPACREPHSAAGLACYR